MILIAGLGNPGKQYAQSRHNLGFHAVDQLAQRFGISAWKTQCEALTAKGWVGQRPFLLVKPQTYMNLSGQALACLNAYYKVTTDDCLVIVDDMDLEVGKIRMRLEGSDGGHRGLRSIIACLHTQQFKRIRIGIGRPSQERDVTGHVLGRDNANEPLIKSALEQAVGFTEEFLKTGSFENTTIS